MTLVRGSRRCNSAELSPREALEQGDVEVALLFCDLLGQRWDIRFRPSRLPRLHERLVVSDLAVVLPDEFFAEFNLFPFLIGLEIPETVFVRGAKRVDEHEAAFLVHRELLLAIHVN